MDCHNTINARIQSVNSFHELISIPFRGHSNAACWDRRLTGNFSEIVDKLDFKDNLTEVNQEMLMALDLSPAGAIARQTILNDLSLLEDHGAAPTLNLIRSYERDVDFPLLPTDVYSYHVDRSPVPTDTFLCTYHGATSDILPNEQAEQKILVPEIRAQLRELFDGRDEDFDAFLADYYFDLHYRAKPGAKPISLGLGQLWRLAGDYPQSECLPCIHRAPRERAGEPRLLLIC